MSLAQVFHYQNGQLHCEEVALATLAEQVGTPCYVYSKNAIRENFQAFRRAFASVDPLICYAVKANSNLSVLRLLKEEGSGFDVVSGGELYRLKQIEADPSGVIFSGVGKTVSELKTALEMGV
ncbi:MAG: diaminopimelate decarboxylase, partial [Acidobacteriota bacterium]